MQTLDKQAIIAAAIATVAEAGPQPTGGQWLEHLTVDVGPFISDWNITQCWHWAEWPERELKQPQSTGQDTGIDVVALNRDGEYVAIQCKSRQLDEHGHGDSINKAEIDSFASASSDDFWSERWIVTNGDNPLGRNAMSAVPKSRPIKVINIANDLIQQQTAFTDESCSHCEPNPDGEERRQSKSCMQAEAITQSIPNVKDDRIRQILADCWERTKDMEVPQFRDGECEVRRLWDEAVADAMGWDADEMARLRELLNKETHVRGLGYSQYADEVDIELADLERFQELADRWEKETVLLSDSDQAANHPAHQEIVNFGTPVVPLVLERMRTQGGHWFRALHDITGADPVKPTDRGNVVAMEESWLHWGADNGYV